MNRRGFIVSLLAGAWGAMGSTVTTASLATAQAAPSIGEAELLNRFRMLTPAQRTAFVAFVRRVHAGEDMKDAAIDLFVACGRDRGEAERLCETAQLMLASHGEVA